MVLTPEQEVIWEEYAKVCANLHKDTICQCGTCQRERAVVAVDAELKRLRKEHDLAVQLIKCQEIHIGHGLKSAWERPEHFELYQEWRKAVLGG